MTAPSWVLLDLFQAKPPVKRMGSSVLATSMHRLHLYSLDLSGESGERAGGVGISVPTWPIEIEVAALRDRDEDSFSPELEDEVTPIVNAVRSRINSGCAVSVTTRSRLLRHKGLGSTTQVRALSALATWSVLAQTTPTFADLLSIDILDAGSCVGLTLMGFPGLTIDFGFLISDQRLDQTWVPHLRQPSLHRKPQGLALHLADPPPWYVVVALTPVSGLSGAAEVEFYSLHLPLDHATAAETCYVTLMDLLPACATGDLIRARAALDAISSLPIKADEVMIQSAATHIALSAMRHRFGFSALSSIGPAVYSITDRPLDIQSRMSLVRELPPGTELFVYSMRDATMGPPDAGSSG